MTPNGIVDRYFPTVSLPCNIPTDVSASGFVRNIHLDTLGVAGFDFQLNVWPAQDHYREKPENSARTRKSFWQWYASVAA